MALSLSQAARDAEDIAAGLQVFEDHVPEDPEIHLNIKGFMQLAKGLLTLEGLYDNRLNSRLNQDVAILLRSLQYTFRRVRAMFGETRYIRNGERLYRVAWEDMSYDMKESEDGQSLNARLGIYLLFVNDMVEALDGQLPPGEMSRHRSWIEWLLRKQAPLEEQLDRLTIDITNTTPRRNSYRPSFRPEFSTPVWDEGEDTHTPRPPAPAVPDDFYETGSPTLSTSTQSTAQTFTTNSSGTAVTGHWAQALFDNRWPTNDFHTTHGITMCQGKPEHGLIERLRQHSLYEVAKFTFRESNLTARFFWRPLDHRSRMLISTTDQLGTQVRMCMPLSDLKLMREWNLLNFYRISTSSSVNGSNPRRLVLWSTFSFNTYEKLILFHCVFAGMKNQDHAYRPTTALRDWPHKSPSQRQDQDEAEIFGAPIEDEGYIHALRVYYDHDSGASRLETRPSSGNMKCCPIWTAFVTDHCQLSGWARKVSSRQVQLLTLRFYVFCDSYTPRQGRNGEVVLTFKRGSDADEFLAAVGRLRSMRAPV